MALIILDAAQPHTLMEVSREKFPLGRARSADLYLTMQDEREISEALAEPDQSPATTMEEVRRLYLAKRVKVFIKTGVRPVSFDG